MKAIQKVFKQLQKVGKGETISLAELTKKTGFKASSPCASVVRNIRKKLGDSSMDYTNVGKSVMITMKINLTDEMMESLGRKKKEKVARVSTKKDKIQAKEEIAKTEETIQNAPTVAKTEEEKTDIEKSMDAFMSEPAKAEGSVGGTGTTN